MEPEEIIEIFRRVIADLERQREDRLQDYREKARVCAGKPVDVAWGGCGLDHQGRVAGGSSGADSIRMVPGYTLPVERSLFVHELSHICLKHSVASGEDHTKSVRDFLNSLPPESRSGVQARIERKELEAHEFAKRLLPVLFPGERYVL